MLFRVCSDNRLFPEAVRVFDYVEEKGFVIEERSCFVLLLALKRCGEIELCLRFFRRMVESNGIEIRVQSLTLVIDGLCKRGEVEKAKELMDEMVTKSIVKPTVFTYNTLLNAYVGRKDRSGVGEILRRDRCGCKPTKEDVKRCFMLEFDRSAFIIASTATEEEMLKWYNEHVVWGDKELKIKLLRKGILTRIYAPTVIIQSLRESGVFSSIIASAPTLSKDKFLHSIDSSNSTRVVASIFHSSRKVGRIKESQATARRILDLESSVFQESAVPPESPPGVVEDSNLISHS
ncbi:unnamed protein product [Vicia faba]|uniref:Pentatricopeptide repeat-containing protein n=1 Tax=Vicia faba TaxID=3906 RepID=A0AAV0ZDS4_VICFA|nr:unnamed protein product [Vicia faba]